MTMMLSEYERGFNAGAESTERACHEQMNRERDQWRARCRELIVAAVNETAMQAWERFGDPRHVGLCETLEAIDAEEIADRLLAEEKSITIAACGYCGKQMPDLAHLRMCAALHGQDWRQHK